MLYMYFFHKSFSFYRKNMNLLNKDNYLDIAKSFHRLKQMLQVTHMDIKVRKLE